MRWLSLQSRFFCADLASVKRVKVKRLLSNKLLSSISTCLPTGLEERLFGDRNSGTGLKKPKVVVIGSGWGGFTFSEQVNKEKYDVTLISPSKYLCFTPLLSEIAILNRDENQFRKSITEISNLSDFIHGEATAVDWRKKEVYCSEMYGNHCFVPFDFLVIACGKNSSLPLLPGLSVENQFSSSTVLPFKSIEDAISIQNELARLLKSSRNGNVGNGFKTKIKIVVLSNGPATIDLTEKMYAFISKHFKGEISCSVTIEHIETSLGQRQISRLEEQATAYGLRLLKNLDPVVRVRKNVNLKTIRDGDIAVYDDGSFHRFDLLICSSIQQETNFSRNGLDSLYKDGHGGIYVDEFLRVRSPFSQSAVFALGDCASLKNYNCPKSAYFARAQALYLAKEFNTTGSSTDCNLPVIKPLRPFNLEDAVFHDSETIDEIIRIGSFGLCPIRCKNALLDERSSWAIWKSPVFSSIIPWKTRIKLFREKAKEFFQ